ncbi:hypothetical protein Tamer19_26210 [Cupriavidus sp. TA19]|nr:hypothetical protein CTP10_R70550 [Cupriavidus sp. P-10]GLC93213.1 hypothetical protein Tamer19_26210 [Cupriavidus sp. TA19]
MTLWRGAPQAVRERFAALQAEAVQIAVIDAISNDDLMRIGPALAGMPLVTAGSGIAIGLPRNWQASGALPEGAKADALPPASGVQAVVSGSCSPATNAQVLHFRHAGRPSFAIDPLAIAGGDDVVGQALAWAGPRLADGPVLVYATADPAAVQLVQSRLGVARAGEMVERTLSQIAVGLVERDVRQLVVAGGETSGAVVQALGVRQMTIGPQIDPGVPWTSVQSAACSGETLHVALKSGNFGTEDFFTKAFDQLEAA